MAPLGGDNGDRGDRRERRRRKHKEIWLAPKRRQQMKAATMAGSAMSDPKAWQTFLIGKYWNEELERSAKRSRKKTAVITPFDLFEYNVMTFSLKSAAQIFQRFMDIVLRGLDFFFCCIDDVLIASANELEHKEHLKQVFNRLKQYGISINLSKCVFGTPSVRYLGYRSNSRGASPIPEKVENIINYLKPWKTDTSESASGAVLQQKLTGIWEPLGKNLLHRNSDTTDHKPLTYAFQQKSDKASPRQLQLDYIGQFTTDITHIPGSANEVVDALSRLDVISLPVVVSTQQLAEHQKTDTELTQLLQGNTSLELKKLRLDDTVETVYCDISGERFKHVHIDIVGPLLPIDGYRYCLTIIDRSSRWPEAVPIKNMAASTVAKAFCDAWINKFGAPATVATDKGSQFEETVFRELTNLIGCKHIHTKRHTTQPQIAWWKDGTVL
nr:PREDICTED: uncharacterized protein K02A2.6-like [Megachile rotundata]